MSSMSKGLKKSGHHSDDSPEAGPTKRDQNSSDEDDEPPQRKGSSHQCSKMSKQGHMSKKSPGISKQSGGHGHHNKPAELFRKDLISAMKLPDTEILYDDEYFAISDPWRQEWEKGVQVPVNEGEIPPIHIVDMKNKETMKDFKMHVRKYLHEKNDETYQPGQHELTGMQELSEQIVRYDLDDMDVTWLELINADREDMGLQLINEWNLERMIEELENQCYAKTNSVKKTEEGLGIEYDEDIACDVCRQLESEDTNEMVFCDGCDICVHQACYGIQTIPEGSWLCRICALGIKPMCLLCPKRGGAMKSTKSGTKWTHVSCALWIPEVSIGSPEKMEPITKISNIPASRWALICCLCKERVGACIQCSVKQCKTAFHVTCGFSHNLDMKTVLDDNDELDGIHLRAYCPKHTKNRNASDSDSPKKSEEECEETEENENDVSEAEMAKQRAEKLKQLEEEFYTLVDTKEISTKFYIPEEAVCVVTEYWKLKRRVNYNKPLITPKVEEENQMQKQQKDSLSARMKMFVHLRQDLERARNLCYMIGKREKTKKQLFKLQESVFRAQITVLTDPNLELTSREAEKTRQTFHFDSIYSSFVHTGSVSKVPRKNLFTLENLKTPKDLMEERNNFEEVIKKNLSKRMSSSKRHLKHKKRLKQEVKEEHPSEFDNESVKEDKLNKFLSDTTADSSENEIMPYDGCKTDSAQMSRLGKVKGGGEIIVDETIVDFDTKEEPQEIVDDTQEFESLTKRTAGSDLKMKLTSILQSKSLKQKQDKFHQHEHLTTALHVDVENSDHDIFSSDTNTDFASPVEQSRNLFDKFKMKDQWSSQSEQTSPDNPPKEGQNEVCHKKGKRKHKQSSSNKHKSSELILSPDRVDVVKSETKGENESCTDRNIFDLGKDDKKPLFSPQSVTDSASGEMSHQNEIKEGSPNSSKIQVGSSHRNKIQEGNAHKNKIHEGITHKNKIHEGNAHKNKIHEGITHKNKIQEGNAHKNKIQEGSADNNKIQEGGAHRNKIKEGSAHRNRIREGSPHNTAKEGSSLRNKEESPHMIIEGSPDNNKIKDGSPHRNKYKERSSHTNMMKERSPYRYKSKECSPHRNRMKERSPYGYKSKEASPHRNWNKQSSPHRNRSKEGSPHRNRSKEGSPHRNRNKEGSPHRNRSKEGSPHRNRSKEGSPHRNRNKESSPHRNRSKEGSPHRNRSKESSPHRNRSKESSPHRNRSKEGSPHRNRSKESSPHRNRSKEGSHKSKVQESSPSKLSLYKKKSSKEWSISSPRDERSSSSKKHKISPSSRVDSDNVYATIDGDIYVPTGKIQVTERTIVLESPKEVKKKQSNKLRLKKRSNSPLKGVISYEVVNSDFDECVNVIESGKDKLDVKPELDISVPMNVDDLCAKKDYMQTEERTKDGNCGKLLSDSESNVSVEQKEAKEKIMARKDLFGITESQTANKEERRLKRSLRSKDRNSELEASSDENFIPSNKGIKLGSPHRPQRDSRSSGQLQPNTKPVIKVQPFPNRPDLNALVDPSKLIVKEPLRRAIGDKLSQFVRSRTRWGNHLKRMDNRQPTLDSFVKRRSDSDISSLDSLTRSDLKTMTNLSTKQLSVGNKDVCVQYSSRKVATHGLSLPPKNYLEENHSVVSGDLSVTNSDSLLMDVKRNSNRFHEDDVLSESSVTSRLSGNEVSDRAERADTPRRSVRNRGNGENSQSPLTPSRLRNREGLAKTTLFKSS